MTPTMRRVVRALVAAGLSAGCARNHLTATDAKTVVVEPIHHSRTYEVNPLNPQDLMRSISDQWRCGGFECKFGETQSHTSFTFNAGPAGSGTCAIKSVHVKVETTITIPHWEPQGVTSAQRRNWWSNIQQAVTRHEHQHVFIAEEGGKAVADSLMHLSGDCLALPSLAVATVNAELLRVEHRQSAFDRSEGPLQITAPPP